MKSLTSIGSHYEASIVWKVAGEAVGRCLEVALVPSQVNKCHHFAGPGNVLCTGVRPEKAVVQDLSFGAQLQDRQHASETCMDHLFSKCEYAGGGTYAEIVLSDCRTPPRHLLVFVHEHLRTPQKVERYRKLHKGKALKYTDHLPRTETKCSLHVGDLSV